MNLKMRRLKHAQDSIRRLIVLGSLVTVAGGAVAAHLIMGWTWRNAILFGTLVMVTGPTVIQPLLKRLKVKRSVATVLEAEGVLIDALGAVVAIVALEAALSPAHASPMMWLWHVDDAAIAPNGRAPPDRRTGGHALGVRRPSQMGWVIPAPAPSARAWPAVQGGYQEVVCIEDSNADHCWRRRTAPASCTAAAWKEDAPASGNRYPPGSAGPDRQ